MMYEERYLYVVQIISDDFQPDSMQAATSIYTDQDRIGKRAEMFLHRWLKANPGRMAHYVASLKDE